MMSLILKQHFKGETIMFIFNRKCGYRAHSIFRNFIDKNDVEVDWFNLMDYQDDPYEPWPNPDGMPTEEDWAGLIADYPDLDRRERWIARIYASQFFSEYDLEDLRKLVRRYFKTSISLEKLPLPLAFKDANSGIVRTPYLFISNPRNTISLCYDIDEAEEMELDNLFDCDFCGHVNIDGQGDVDLDSLAWDYSIRLRN
jgi:hypothetical protein